MLYFQLSIRNSYVIEISKYKMIILGTKKMS